MARLSAENSATHLAALKTPDQKATRKSSRFKEFFKGSHSRASLSSSYNTSPLGASPLGGFENLEPGFKKVGLHPSERSPLFDAMNSLPSEPSRLLDLEDQEKVKEETEGLGRFAKMQLYEEQEELSKYEEDNTEHAEESSMIERPRAGTLKAMKVLGIESSAEEKKEVDIAHLTAENRDATTMDSLVQDKDQDRIKGITINSLAEVLHVAYESSTDSSTDIVSAAASPTLSRHHSLRHSAPLDGLRTSTQSQILPSDSISNIGYKLDDEPVGAYLSVTHNQHISDAINLREYRFPRFGIKDSDTAEPHTIASDRFHYTNPVDLDAHSTKLPPIAKISKIGPWEVEASTAHALTKSLLPFTYAVLLLAKAMQGPANFFIAIWKILAMAVAYTGLRRLMCWNKDGSSDVLLAPVEESLHMVKQCCMQMMEAFARALAHAAVVALRELHADDEL